jgi:hypothetical protein
VKSFICLVTILGSLSVFAKTSDPADSCSHCPTTKVEGNPVNSGGLSQIDKLAKGMERKEKDEATKIKVLANRLCSRLLASQAFDNLSARDAFKSTIANHLGIQVTGKNTRKKVIDFFNLNKNKMICTIENPKYSSPQHVMRRMIDMRIQEEVFFEFLLEDDSDEYKGKVDLNIVYKNAEGKEETMLDYIETIVSDTSTKGSYNHDELRDLQEMLQDQYGGKYVRYASRYPGFALDSMGKQLINRREVSDHRSFIDTKER